MQLEEEMERKSEMEWVFEDNKEDGLKLQDMLFQGQTKLRSFKVSIKLVFVAICQTNTDLRPQI